MSTHGLLPIGAFSQLTRLSVRALRRYDEQGLLVPAHVDAGSLHRYYSPAQVADAQVIRTLRALDMPLAEINAIVGAGACGTGSGVVETGTVDAGDAEAGSGETQVGGVDAAGLGAVGPAAVGPGATGPGTTGPETLGPETVYQRLVRHRERLRSELDHRGQMLAGVELLLADLSAITRRPVEVRDLPEQVIVSIRFESPLSGLGGRFGPALGRVLAHLREVAVAPCGPPVAIYHGSRSAGTAEAGGFDPERLDVEVGMPVPGWVRAGDGVDVRALPAVRVLCTLHSGPYQGIGAAYAAIAHRASTDGVRLGIQPRELHLVGPDRAGPEGLRTEVAWPLAD